MAANRPAPSRRCSTICSHQRSPSLYPAAAANHPSGSCAILDSPLRGTRFWILDLTLSSPTSTPDSWCWAVCSWLFVFFLFFLLLFAFSFLLLFAFLVFVFFCSCVLCLYVACAP